MWVIHAALFSISSATGLPWRQPKFFELEGIVIPHGTSAQHGPIAVLVDAIIKKIRGVNPGTGI
ncbi:hypothetical protein ACNKHL_12710 [Shigella flexneri]